MSGRLFVMVVESAACISLRTRRVGKLSSRRSHVGYLTAKHVNAVNIRQENSLFQIVSCSHQAILIK